MSIIYAFFIPFSNKNAIAIYVFLPYIISNPENEDIFTMKKSVVNVGFIGAGSFITAHHLPTAYETSFINIRAIADLNPEMLAVHAEKFSPDYTTSDYKQLLDDPEIDLIVIGTRQDTHAKLIVEALDAGKWVWCEKPMCDTPEEEAAVIAAEERAAGKLAIGFNRRFAPAVTKSLEILKNLPRPWIINYRLQTNDYYKNMKHDTFYYDRAHIIYEGCHMLDLANFIYGTLPERLFMSGTEEENDIVILEYADGSRFVLTITSQAGAPMLEKEMIEIFTRNGAISMRDFIELRVRSVAGEKDYLFLPERCKYNTQIARWGYPFWETLRSRLVEPDANRSRGIVSVIPAMEDQPFAEELAKIADAEKDAPWQERNIFCDKGWKDAFCHFARACMEKSEPLTADGKAGKIANDMGFALIESKKLGMPVNFTTK